MIGLLVLLTVLVVGVLAFLSYDVYKLHGEIKKMAISFDDLITKVTALKTVQDSAIALLQGLKAQLDAAIAALPNQTQLQSLSDSLDTDTADMAAAVVANTPAA